MVYVALGEAASLLVVVLTFAGLLRSQSRAHARREDLLVNQLCNLAGAPWSPAPADDRRAGLREPQRPSRDLFTTSPEQEP